MNGRPCYIHELVGIHLVTIDLIVVLVSLKPAWELKKANSPSDTATYILREHHDASAKNQERKNKRTFRKVAKTDKDLAALHPAVDHIPQSILEQRSRNRISISAKLKHQAAQ